MQRGQEEALERAVERVEQEKPYLFRKKSHQIQYDFNEQVKECIKNAKDKLRKGLTHGTAMTKVLKELDEDTELLAMWQKIIKIANRSELGWKVVREYEAGELALEGLVK